MRVVVLCVINVDLLKVETGSFLQRKKVVFVPRRFIELRSEPEET